MTEIPEHLLRRAREARLRSQVGGMYAPPTLPAVTDPVHHESREAGRMARSAATFRRESPSRRYGPIVFIVVGIAIIAMLAVLLLATGKGPTHVCYSSNQITVRATDCNNVEINVTNGGNS